MSSVWILEYRYWERKNGKWSEWLSMDNVSRAVCAAYTSYPAEKVFSHEKYERRAIEYKRAEVA